MVALIDAEQAPILARPYYAGEGPPSPITASLAHVPEVLEATLPFVGRILGPTAIDLRAKGDRHSADVGSDGVPLLRRGPHDRRPRLRPLRRRGARPAGEREVEAVFTNRDELALISWVDEVALGRGAAPEDITARAREVMGDPELVEMTLVVAATLMLNRYCSALGLPTSAATLARLAEEGLA